tara:strand:- start:312 stop:674 length:363 start_codon:yes stop_codon:yes gene_type:complete
VLKEKFAQEAAEILIDIGAVSISIEKPFTLTSGGKALFMSIVEKLFHFQKNERSLCKWLYKILQNRASFDVIAGGETSGIPFAAWISELTSLPMIYKKEVKGFWKNKRIEGEFKPNSSIL